MMTEEGRTGHLVQRKENGGKKEKKVENLFLANTRYIQYCFWQISSVKKRKIKLKK